MYFKLRIVVLVSIVALFGVTLKTEQVFASQGAYYGQGAQPCSRYLQVRSGSDGQSIASQAGFYGWMYGYLSAHNILLQKIDDLLAGQDTKTYGDARLMWLDGYCRNNAMKSFKDALDAMIFDINPKAISTRPKK